MNWELIFTVALLVFSVNMAYLLGRRDGRKSGHLRGVMEENRRMQSLRGER